MDIDASRIYVGRPVIEADGQRGLLEVIAGLLERQVDALLVVLAEPVVEILDAGKTLACSGAPTDENGRILYDATSEDGVDPMDARFYVVHGSLTHLGRENRPAPLGNMSRPVEPPVKNIAGATAADSMHTTPSTHYRRFNVSVGDCEGTTRGPRTVTAESPIDQSIPFNVEMDERRRFAAGTLIRFRAIGTGAFVGGA